MTMISRRNALLATLFGSGYVGLRALATGVPVSLLLNPRRALASATPCAAGPEKPQYLIISTSAEGDSLNACVPGTYDDPLIVHSVAPELAPAPLTLNGRTFSAAAPWSTLAQDVLDRTVFWHLMTNTPVHADESRVLRLMGAIDGPEMFPSLLAKRLAPCLGTIQPQPISVGALTPAESLSYEGAALPVIPPLALKATLTKPDGPLSGLAKLREATLAQLDDVYRQNANSAQKQFLDSLIASRHDVLGIEQDLLDALSAIQDNGPASQILAALTLIRMNVSPVVTLHIPFGGDNHRDVGLATESAGTVTGIAAVGFLMQQLASAGLSDRVTFATLNVFGRTLGPGNENGRTHNPNHQVSLTIGAPFRGGVVGAVGPVGGDYGALPIDSGTGAGGPGGDIAAIDSLAAFGRTLLKATGADMGDGSPPSASAQVVSAALRSSS